MTTQNKNLHQARRDKNDEFYTQLVDIEAELAHYRDHFRNKTVYLNCDDPVVSQFWRYFADRFNDLGLRRLIATHYVPDGTSTVAELSGSGARVTPLQGDGDFLRPKLTLSRGSVTPLQGDGDFRSGECVALLEQADVVVTNPPFSLFREFVSQLTEYDKDFIVLGNINAITYKDVWPHIQAGRVWLGPSISSGDREFQVPQWYPLNAQRSRIDDKGNRYVRVTGVRWFTTLEHDRRRQPLSLTRSYYDDPSLYPTYDNHDAIEVSRTAHIPADYDGVMGVPITFLDKYDPDQFELLGISYNFGRPAGWPLDVPMSPSVAGRNTYARLFIKHRR